MRLLRHAPLTCSARTRPSKCPGSGYTHLFDAVVDDEAVPAVLHPLGLLVVLVAQMVLAHLGGERQPEERATNLAVLEGPPVAGAVRWGKTKTEERPRACSTRARGRFAGQRLRVMMSASHAGGTERPGARACGGHTSVEASPTPKKGWFGLLPSASFVSASHAARATGAVRAGAAMRRGFVARAPPCPPSCLDAHTLGSASPRTLARPPRCALAAPPPLPLPLPSATATYSRLRPSRT